MVTWGIKIMSFTEMLLVLALTFITSLGIIKYSIRLRSKGVMSVMKSQSTIHSKVRHLLPTNQKVVKHNSQSRNFVSERTTKMIAIDDKAYWIRDNRFFVAEIIDGKVNHDTAQEVDIINMPKKDLDKMLFIIDNLKDDE